MGFPAPWGRRPNIRDYEDFGRGHSKLLFPSLGWGSPTLNAVLSSISSGLYPVYGISQLLEGMALGEIRAVNLNLTP